MFLRTVFMRLVAVIATLVIAAPGAFALETEAPPTVPDEVARLVPEDAVVFAYTSSVTDLTKALSALVGAVDPQMAGMVAFMGPQAMLPQAVRTEQKVLVDQPVAIALSSRGDSITKDPIATIIFSVEGASPETVKPKGRGDTLIFLEGTNWLAVTNGPVFTPRPASEAQSSLTTNLLPGIVSASFDQAAFMKIHGAEIKQLVAERPESDAPFRHMMGDETVENMVEGFSRWDLGLGMKDAMVDVLLQFIPTNPSWSVRSDTDLSPLSNRLAGDLPIQLVVDKQILHWYMNFISSLLNGMDLEGMDSESLKKIGGLIDDADLLVDEMEIGIGQSVGFGEHGIDVVQPFKVKSAARTFAMIDAYVEKMNAAKLGFAVERMRVLVGGDSSRAFKVKFNANEFEKAFPVLAAGMAGGPGFSDVMSFYGGEDGFVFRIISNGNWMAIVAGDPKLLGRARRALAQPAKSERAISTLESRIMGNMAIGMSMDYRAFMVGITEDAASMKNPFMYELMGSMELKPGPPAMIDMAVSSHGEGTLLSVYADVGRVAAIAKQMEEAAEKAAKEKAGHDEGDSDSHDHGPDGSHEGEGNEH